MLWNAVGAWFSFRVTWDRDSRQNLPDEKQL
jgi:hypothetical protein